MPLRTYRDANAELARLTKEGAVLGEWRLARDRTAAAWAALPDDLRMSIEPPPVA